MESRLIFRPRPLIVELSGDPGTKRERLCGWPFKDVGQPRSEYEEAGQPNSKSCRVGRQEKPDREVSGRPYRKPTQVG